MSIYKDRRDIFLECDECGDSQNGVFDIDEFNHMIGMAKDDGWQIVRENGEWVHRCPSCKPSEFE